MPKSPRPPRHGVVSKATPAVKTPTMSRVLPPGAITLEKDPEKVFYVTHSCTDLTEGRGTQFPLAISKLEATAKRIGKGRYVQGSDCPTTKVEAYKINGTWYLPLSAVPLQEPSEEDKRIQSRENLRQQAIEKAKRAGLSDDDIKMISQGL